MCRCFREIERVDYIMEVLTRCRHNGFPVVSSGLGDEQDSGDFDAAGQGASRSGSLQGIILRSQILVMLRHQVSTHSRPSSLDTLREHCQDGAALHARAASVPLELRMPKTLA